MGWPKSSFGFFCNILWINLNELFGHPNSYKILNQYTEISCISIHYNFSKRKVKKTILFTIASKIIKYLGINLTKEMKDLYSENYTTMIKKY